MAKHDAYIKGLSPFERAAKILKAGPVSTEEYIDFIGAQTLEWDENDKAKLKKIIQIASSKLAPYARHIPPYIYLIKTTGKDEGAAPYTRGISIVLPNRTVRQSTKGLERLFYHELFHIISRNNTQLRDELYALIGFNPCGVVSLPDDLMPRRISNPDAPVVEHCIRVTENDMPHWVAPVLFSRIPEYDPKVGGTFFRYLEMRLMAIDRDTAKPILRDDKPVMFQPREVEDFSSRSETTPATSCTQRKRSRTICFSDYGKTGPRQPGDSEKNRGCPPQTGAKKLGKNLPDHPSVDVGQSILAPPET